MSEQARVNENTWAQWERGNIVALPDPDQFARMVEAVGGTELEALRSIGYLEDVEVEADDEDYVRLFSRMTVEVMQSGLSPYLKSVIVTALRHARELQEAATGEDVSATDE